MIKLTMRILTLCLALLTAPVLAFAQSEVVVASDVTSDATWMSDNTYILDGLIFVDEGATLTIEAGTVVKARLAENITTGDGASALIVRRGARLEAVGTAQQPVIFTSELDEIADATDLSQRDRGLWGGVILLGTSTTNQGGLTQIEGIPVEDEEAQFGCDPDGGVACDEDDDSGILRYVSIRHGGFSISGDEGDEINGLTLGGVGRGTTIEYVEVYANFDDGFEWFGGTVEAKYLVAAFAGDDSFDYDQGFRGKGQFWFSIHDTDQAGRGGEHDGGDDAGDDAEPLSRPVITNVTYVGAGADATVSGGDGNDRAFAIRDAAGGLYYNSIFTDFPGVALNIEDLEEGVDSRTRLEDGDLVFENNIFWGFGAGESFADIVDGDFADDAIASANSLTDPELAGISRTMDAGLDPRPMAGSPVLTGATGFDGVLVDAFFAQVDYRGAFGEDLWLEGWTALDGDGFLGRISNVLVEPVAGGDVPASITLEQNYPNPFNPSTTVEFGMDQAQHVRLAVYDLLGRELDILADKTFAPGTYRSTFDASGLSSGLYIYRIETETATITRTMTLVK